MMSLLCFADASTLQNDRDNPPEGIQANQSREAPTEGSRKSRNGRCADAP